MVANFIFCRKCLVIRFVEDQKKRILFFLIFTCCTIEKTDLHLQPQKGNNPIVDKTIVECPICRGSSVG